MPLPMHGQGTKLFYHNGAAYVQLANLMDADLPVAERGSVERTPMDQPLSDKYRKYYPNPLVDGGECTFNLLANFQATEQGAILTKLKTAGNHDFKVELPDTGTTHGTELVFNGHITSIGLVVQAEEDMMRPVKFKVSGEPTVTDPD